MRIVHMADSHLGFSNYNRVDRLGRNVVEEMIYKGFEEAIERIVDLSPDALVHAGDVFHHVRPRIRPLYVFKKALERLVDAGIPVIIISGNHDSPKSYSHLSPFYMYEGLDGVFIAHRYRLENFEAGDHTFHCLPFCLDPHDYMAEFEKIRLSGSDVLVMHGIVEALRNERMMTVGEHEINDSLLKSDFDYIALGHYHGQAQISGNAWYSGSIEYFNFGEARQVKGLLQVDLESGRVEQIPIRPLYMIDHPPLDCSGMRPEEIIEGMEDLCQEMEGRMVRLNLINVGRGAYRRIDQSRINRLASRAIHLMVRVEYEDEAPLSRRERVDVLGIPEEFGRFICEEGGISPAIEKEVVEYGTGLFKNIVAANQTEALDAPQ
ncbi:MAG: metallophosphoesterase [Methanotrichaceae archaeon]|nr:metallophosphoesterase [Methanotrichaceae archaeon]